MSYFPADREAELRQLFFESAQELLQVLNEEALKLETDPANPETARTIRRTVHTLKGDAAACGFRELSDLAHELEDALGPEIAHSNPAEVAELVLSAADVFDANLAAYRNNLQPPAAEPLRAMIRSLSSAPAAQPIQTSAGAATNIEWGEYERLAIDQALAAGKKVYCVTVELDPQCPMKSAARQLLQNVWQHVGQVLAMYPQGAISDDLGRVKVAIISEQAPDQIAAKCRIPAVSTHVAIEAMTRLGPEKPALEDEGFPSTVAPAPGPSAASGSENILRVDAERIDHLLNLIGELIIGRSMLHQVLAEFSHRLPKDPLRHQFTDAMAFQTRVLNDLQRTAMQVRMVPVESLFRRFPRLVRDLAKQCGKDVGLLLNGQDTELDKSILDAVAEPLAHLVRNAVDHGIETEKERLKLGKNSKGNIRLNAYHQGNHVVIEVGDDGRGLDPPTILRKAIERRLLRAEEAAQLPEAAVLQLVFQPGFSTAEQVTEISGRGVGLDIVQNVARRLKGTVSIESKSGLGTTFLLKVPLTLAIIKALLLRAEQRLYAIPLNAVLEIARANEAEIHCVDNYEVLQLRNTVLTLVRLGAPLDLGPEESNRRLFIVVIAVGDRKYGLIVDGLVGEEELVIKPLDDQVVATDLVSGASILGDGTVVLILNLPAVVERYARRDLAPFTTQRAMVAETESSAAELQGGLR